MADEINPEALRFVRASSVEVVLAAAFRMRLETFFRDEEDEETLQAWFEGLGYTGLTLADLEKASAYQESHHVGFWSGHYSLIADGALFGELSIVDEEVRFDGVLVENVTYDAGKLMWEGSTSSAHRGSLSFSTVGDARAKSFRAGHFGKQARGTIQRDASSKAATVLGNTVVVSFDAAEKSARPSTLLAGAHAAANATANGDAPATASYAPLDPWNDEYSTRRRPLGSNSEKDWSGDTRFTMKLFNDKGDVGYGGQVFAVTDYSTSGAAPVNGKAHENNLIWDDSAGPSGTKGNVQFTSYRGVKLLKGTIRPKGASVDQQIEGTQVEDEAGYSTVDIFVIAGTVIAGFMMIAAIPLLKSGAEKLGLEWKKMTGTATDRDVAELERLAQEVRKQDFEDFAKRLSEHNIDVPTTPAELAQLAVTHDGLEQQARTDANTALQAAAQHEQAMQQAEAAIEKARDYIRNIDVILRHDTEAVRREARQRAEKLIENREADRKRERDARDVERDKQREHERVAQEHKRIAELAKRLK